MLKDAKIPTFLPSILKSISLLRCCMFMYFFLYVYVCTHVFKFSVCVCALVCGGQRPASGLGLAFHLEMLLLVCHCVWQASWPASL